MDDLDNVIIVELNKEWVRILVDWSIEDDTGGGVIEGDIHCRI